MSRLTRIRDPPHLAHLSLDISESHSILPAVSQTSYTQGPSPTLVLLLFHLPLAELPSLLTHPTLIFGKSSTIPPRNTPNPSPRMTLPKSPPQLLRPMSKPSLSLAKLAVQTVLEPDTTLLKMGNIPYVPHVSSLVDSHPRCSLVTSSALTKLHSNNQLRDQDLNGQIKKPYSCLRV